MASMEKPSYIMEKLSITSVIEKHLKLQKAVATMVYHGSMVALLLCAGELMTAKNTHMTIHS